MVLSTLPTGTISQTARGFVRLSTNSGSEAAPTAFSLHQLFDRLCGLVEHNALMSAPQQAAHHVRSHPAKTDHSQLHGLILL